MTYATRNAALAALTRATGAYTLQELGDVCGVSRERVRQILVREGVTTRYDTTEPLALLRLIRRDRTIRSFAATSLQRMNTAAHIRSMLTELGMLAAFQRLFRLRRYAVGAEKRRALVARYRAYVAEEGREPNAQTLMAWGVQGPSIFGRNYVAKIRAAARGEPVGVLRPNIQRGLLTQTILAHAGRPNGVSYAEAVRSLDGLTTAQCVNTRLGQLTKAGRLVKTGTWRRYRYFLPHPSIGAHQ